MIVEQNQRFLVVRRPSGRVVFPGGFIRWHELPEQTLVREGKEETGLVLQPVRVLGYYPLVSHKMTRMSVFTIVYIARISNGGEELRESIEGKPDWLTEAQLTETFTSFYRTVLQDYLQQRKP